MDTIYILPFWSFSFLFLFSFLVCLLASFLLLFINYDQKYVCCINVSNLSQNWVCNQTKVRLFASPNLCPSSSFNGKTKQTQCLYGNQRKKHGVWTFIKQVEETILHHHTHRFYSKKKKIKQQQQPRKHLWREGNAILPHSMLPSILQMGLGTQFPWIRFFTSQVEKWVSSSSEGLCISRWFIPWFLCYVLNPTS